MNPPPLPPRRSKRSPSALRIVVSVLGGLVILAALGGGILVATSALKERLARPTRGIEYVLALEPDASLDAEARQADAKAVVAILKDRLRVLDIGFAVRPGNDGHLVVRVPELDEVTLVTIRKHLTRWGSIEFHRVHATGPRRPAVVADDEAALRELSLTTERHDQGQTEQLWVTPIPGLTGGMVERAYVYPDYEGTLQIGIRFTPAGGARFAEVTRTMAEASRSTGHAQRIAIVIDGEAITAPTVREAITGGSAVITGTFTEREAHELANLINNPLHTRVHIVEQRPFGD